MILICFLADRREREVSFEGSVQRLWIWQAGVPFQGAERGNPVPLFTYGCTLSFFQLQSVWI